MPASPITDLGRPLAVVAHDAGAAHLIMPWLDPASPPRAVMGGPAVAAWRRRMGDATLLATIDEALDGATTLLTGTGWSSDLEHDARVAAHARGITSIAVVDHWVNYRARFMRHGNEQLPDVLWVTDAEALAIACAEFVIPVVQQPNGYLSAQTASIGPPLEPAAALYVLEPARSDWGRDRPGEFQALDWFMANRASVGMAPTDPVRVRPHPSDPSGKYDEWLRVNPAARLDDAPSLDAAIGRAGLVIGAETQAMVVALAAGRRVICSLPPWAPPCRLPHVGITRLSPGPPDGAMLDFPPSSV